MKLIDFKTPFLAGDLRAYRYMFTKHWWNILNIRWHPGPTSGGTRGALYPGPAGTVARESLSAHDQFFCNQA